MVYCAIRSESSSKTTAKTSGTRLTLRGLLHYLWDESKLSHWTPEMEGKRSWFTVRSDLNHRRRQRPRLRAHALRFAAYSTTFGMNRSSHIGRLKWRESVHGLLCDQI